MYSHWPGLACLWLEEGICLQPGLRHWCFRRSLTYYSSLSWHFLGHVQHLCTHAAQASRSPYGANKELVKDTGCLHAKGWEWNVDITYLSLSVLPKPHSTCPKVEGTARSSHKSRLKQDHLAVFSLWRSISVFDAFLCSSKQIPMTGLCLCKPLGRVCVFLFVPHLYHHYYYWHNLISTGPDGLFWICWSSCRLGPWIISVYGHLLTASQLITRSIL